MEHEIEPEPRTEGRAPERERALDDEGPSSPVASAAEERLIRLMEEFRRRQRKCPNLVVRPWWTPGEAASGPGPGRGSVGFVVEYCPSGVETVELAVRLERVRVEGPAGLREARLDLSDGWELDGEDRVCQETLANYLLRMADQLLESEAA